MELLNIESLPSVLQNATASYSFAAGQRIFRQGDRIRNFYIVESGRIKLVRNTIEGRTIVLKVVSRGEILGENALISDFYSCTAIAEVESIAIAFPQSLLKETIRQYPDLAEDLIEKLVGKINSFEISLELLQIKAAHQRLLQYLQYKAAFSTIVNLDRPWKEVAAELDLTPRTLSRALSRLESEGRIDRQSGSITLLETEE